MNITDSFVETLYTLKSRSLPNLIVREARLCLMDEVGTMVAGSAIQGDKLGRYLDAFSGDDATVVGLGRRASLQNAALCNGISGHAYDFDDGHRFSTVHLGSVVIPPVLAVTEKEGLSMEDAIRGIVIGYEAGIRLGRCIQPSHRNRGFHSSGTAGAVAAAMGVAAALDFNKEQMKATLAAACSSAGGINEMMENVSTMKPFNVGRAAHDGVTAAYIAAAGFQGPYDPMLGKFGFLRTACDVYDASVLSLETDDGYNICGGYHKPYASCRHTHGAVYATVRAVNDNDVRWQDITDISVSMYGQGVNGHEHTDIPGVVAGKMSTPFCIALALKTGKIGIDSFVDETINDPDILHLTQLVSVKADEEMTSWVPNKRAARSTVTTKEGKKYTYQADYAPGEPELPMTQQDFEKKFTELWSASGKSPEQIKIAIDMILHHNGTVAEFMQQLV
ncbi:MAG: MmgE/PrpD family protein [Clostridia bacterium]|nr:MmgE/PrpD family protein [Clostridia bacterium]